MKEVICLVGIQGSGKSTYAKNKKLYEDLSIQVISSDAIREENPTLKNHEVFNEVYRRMYSAMSDGKTVILDATGITIKSRKGFIDWANRFPEYKKVAVVFNTPYKTCIERVKARNDSEYKHFIPMDVLHRYYESFQMPTYDEGFDEIILNTDHVLEEDSRDIATIIDLRKALDFKHHDPYHGDETVFRHCYKILNGYYNLPKDKRSKLCTMDVLLHDYGKMFAAKNKKDSEYLCYHHHENIGTYEILCRINNKIFKKFYKSLFVCNYHMMLMNGLKEDKLNSMFRKENVELLKIFSELDKNSTQK